MTPDWMKGLGQTPFQKEFEVDADFYSGKQIRDAILKHFPGFEGLAFIVARQHSYRPNSEEHLREIIPDKPPEAEDLPPKNLEAFVYIIAESRHPDTATVVPVTVFQPSELGYICVEQRMD